MSQTSKIKNCAQICWKCAQTCLDTIQHCISIGGKHVEPNHFKLLLSCAEICQANAKFLMAEMSFHQKTCGVCAEICLECSDSCKNFGDDDQMLDCAEVCRECGESCQDMSTTSLAA